MLTTPEGIILTIGWTLATLGMTGVLVWVTR